VAVTWMDTVAHWHRTTFPVCDVRDIALKLCEEAGEVARAVVEVRHPSRNGTGRTADLADELGDVLIAAAALSDRAGIDLHEAVTNRTYTVVNR
jgi:NTP pyrophosphatase (non-canonical NTP hydrolase)